MYVLRDRNLLYWELRDKKYFNICSDSLEIAMMFSEKEISFIIKNFWNDLHKEGIMPHEIEIMVKYKVSLDKFK